MTDTSSHNRKIVQQFTRWARPFAELAAHSEADGMRRTLAAARLEPHMRVLDVACGPGLVACAAAVQAGHVTGLDLTPAMIEQATERQRRDGLANVTWQIGNATQLPFADQSFDVTLTRYSFHHMPDPGTVLREMKRVTRPGGRIVVIDATPSPQTQAAYDRMEILRDPSHASALTLPQLRALGLDAGLIEETIDGYGLDVKLQSLADAADMAALVALFDADIRGGKDLIGRCGAPRRRRDILPVPGLDRGLVPGRRCQSSGGHVVRIQPRQGFIDIKARMHRQAALHHVARQNILVILADAAYRRMHLEELFQRALISHQGGEIARRPELPRHIAGRPQPGKTVAQRGIMGFLQRFQHALRIEPAVDQMFLTGRQDQAFLDDGLADIET